MPRSVPRILQYGKNPLLLQSRTWVLESAGYQVYDASQFSDWKHLVHSEAFDLHLLCHTLSLKEADQAVTILPPEAKIVSLTTDLSARADSTYIHVLGDFFSPKTLLVTLSTVLGSFPRQSIETSSRDESKFVSAWN